MNIGCIGAGNMGGAIINGYINKKRELYSSEDNNLKQGEGVKTFNSDENSNIYVFDRDVEKVRNMQTELGINVCESAREIVSKCQIIFLAVKPNVCSEVLKEIEDGFLIDKILVSMAAGITMEFIQKHFRNPVKIVRIMPNTPALVGESMTAVCQGSEVNDEELFEVLEILNSIGRTMIVNEEDIHAVIGVSGSSPAYVYMFIDAIARAGAKKGLDYDNALILAAQSVLGAAKMVLETGREPEDLVDMVCSPNGTTIEAVNVLRSNGFTERVAEGVFAATEKSIKMSEGL